MIWTRGSILTDRMRATALAIFVFDAIIQNPDRRIDNPNCLVRHEELRIIDHEMTFMQSKILFWKQPWVAGSLEHLREPGNHIFWEPLRGQGVDCQAIRRAWESLSDQRLTEYRTAIPTEWAPALGEVESAIDLIRGARDKIDDCLTEVQRVLK